MKILLYSNLSKDNNYNKTKEIASYLIEKKVDIVVSSKMISYFSDLDVQEFNPSMNDINLLIVLGGDGTFLSAAHAYYKYHMPYLGLNLGRVGYLTECDMNECYQIIDKVLANNYKINTKALLEIKVINENGFQKMVAFNETLVHRGNYMKMLKIDMKVQEHFMDTFYADGVLVSTSMGSSAYNLSAGGPLLLDNVNGFVITAICSQSGIMPSVVISDEDQVEISAFTKDNQKYVVIVDGKVQIDVSNGTKVFIKKSSEDIRILSINSENKKINHITKAFNGYIK